MKSVTVSGKSLESLLGNEAMLLDSLFVEGIITAEDFHLIRRCVAEGNLSSVDLSGCEIEGGEFRRGVLCIRMVIKDILHTDCASSSFQRTWKA